MDSIVAHANAHLHQFRDIRVGGDLRNDQRASKVETLALASAVCVRKLHHREVSLYVDVSNF